MKKLKFIGLEELLEKKANSEKFKVVDVLSEESYRDGHIPGAINIPGDKLLANAANSLKKTDVIVVYCGGYSCPASTNATATLLKAGYSKAVDFKAGKKGWIAAGLELEI